MIVNSRRTIKACAIYFVLKSWITQSQEPLECEAEILREIERTRLPVKLSVVPFKRFHEFGSLPVNDRLRQAIVDFAAINGRVPFCNVYINQGPNRSKLYGFYNAYDDFRSLNKLIESVGGLHEETCTYSKFLHRVRKLFREDMYEIDWEFRVNRIGKRL